MIDSKWDFASSSPDLRTCRWICRGGSAVSHRSTKLLEIYAGYEKKSLGFLIILRIQPQMFYRMEEREEGFVGLEKAREASRVSQSSRSDGYAAEEKSGQTFVRSYVGQL